MQHILDHAPVLVHVKDCEGRYLLVNRLWEQRFHLSREQLVGRHVRDVHAPEQADVLLANDLKVLQADSPLEFEETVKQDESLHIYLSTKFPLHDAAHIPYAVCGISLDITERKGAEKALRDSEALYHSLVETLPVCLFRKDLQGRFAFANRPFCLELKKPLADIVGKTDEDIYPIELAQKYMRDDQRVIETGEVFEDIEEHPGDERGNSYVRVLKAPLRDSREEVVGMQGIFWDITDRKRAEEELARASAEFRVARRIQQKLFPTHTPEVAGMDIGGATFGFDIGGASYPAEAIGGDYYDYLPLLDGSLGVAIGDVSGHGIGPALLMAEVRAYLRAFANMHAEPADILDRVNRIILPDIEGDRFITLLLARLEPRADRSPTPAPAIRPATFSMPPERSSSLYPVRASRWASCPIATSPAASRSRWTPATWSCSSPMASSRPAPPMALFSARRGQSIWCGSTARRRRERSSRTSIMPSAPTLKTSRNTTTSPPR